MHSAARLIFGLIACVGLPSAWGGESFNECITEPIFEGRVCTVQANRDAKTGVILIHGLEGSTDDWKHTLPALAENFHVVAFDLPGFGKSDKGSQEYSPTRYARLAHFLADRYFPDKPYHVIGHSMGGAIALRFAAQQPQRFQRLILIDAAGILHPLVITKYQAGSMLQDKSGVPQTRGFAERLSGRILEKMEGLPISPSDIVNTALGRDRVLQGGPNKIAALDLAGEDFSYAIASVTAPTLILWGDSDPIAPLRTGRVLAANMQHARLNIVADSGHEPMKDQTDMVNALIKRHLLISDQALSDRYQNTTAPPALTSKRVGKCSSESGKVFEGDYRSIEIRDCGNVTIRNARVGELSVFNSNMIVSDTDITGSEFGLKAEDAEITWTNGEISAEIAISALRSHLDLAGVKMTGTLASIKGVDSKLLCSICRVNSPVANGALHDFRNIIENTL